MNTNAQSPFFSIIVPIYNVEKYLAECLDSILCQNYKDYELICINDGSTDNSLSILEKYSDSRIRIINQSNKGLSAARNSGLNIAKGQYVWFMDSDDKIADNSLEKLFLNLQSNNVKAIFFNAKAFIDNEYNSSYKPGNYTRHSHGEMNIEKFFNEEMINKSFFVQACCYVYKREHYQSLKFKDGILHEDNLFMLQLIFHDTNTDIFVMNDRFFVRRIRDGSIMTVNYSLKNFMGYHETIIGLGKYAEIKNITNIYYYKFISTMIRNNLKGHSNLNNTNLSFQQYFNVYKKIKNIDLITKACLYFPSIVTLLKNLKKLIS